MTRIVRLSIPMRIETREAIERLAEVTGASAGSTAASFLDEMAPSFLRLAEAYKAAKLDPSKGADLINSLANESSESLQQEQTKLNKKVKK